jgi:hypothetical protein
VYAAHECMYRPLWAMHETARVSEDKKGAGHCGRDSQRGGGRGLLTGRLSAADAKDRN